MKKNKSLEKLINNFYIPFTEMDRCSICNKYDTIQVYFEIEKDKWIHVCESCGDKILKERGAS